MENVFIAADSSHPFQSQVNPRRDALQVQRCTTGAELPFQLQRVLVALAAEEWPHCSVQGSPWPAARRVRPSPKPDEFNEAHLAPLTLIGVPVANQLILYRQG